MDSRLGADVGGDPNDRAFEREGIQIQPLGVDRARIIPACRDQISRGHDGEFEGSDGKRCDDFPVNVRGNHVIGLSARNQHVLPVGEKEPLELWPGGAWHHEPARSACRRHGRYSVAVAEEDQPRRAPRASGRAGHRTELPRLSVWLGYGEKSIGEEPERTPVGRPERRAGPVRAGHGFCLESIDATQPEVSGSIRGGKNECEATAIRRKCQRSLFAKGTAGRGKDRRLGQAGWDGGCGAEPAPESKRY